MSNNILNPENRKFIQFDANEEENEYVFTSNILQIINE